MISLFNITIITNQQIKNKLNFNDYKIVVKKTLL